MKNILIVLCLLLFAVPAMAQEEPAVAAMPAAAEPAAEPVIPAPAAGDAAIPETAAAPMEEQAGFSRGSVTRSAFTTVIEDREPAENLTTLSNGNERVMYFTELRDMEGQTAVHRWEYNGEVMAEVSFQVRGPRWRVWSSKSFVPGWTGDWKVSVLNAAGEIISEDVLAYTEAPAAAMPSEPAADATADPAPQDPTLEAAPAVEPAPAN